MIITRLVSGWTEAELTTTDPYHGERTLFTTWRPQRWTCHDTIKLEGVPFNINLGRLYSKTVRCQTCMTTHRWSFVLRMGDEWGKQIKHN